jgi:hypothetical protein
VDRDEQELIDLIIWLPPGSAFGSLLEANGNLTKAHSLYGWSQKEELLLGIANLISEQTWVLAQSNSKKKIPEPKPVPGPRSKSRPSGTDANAIARSLLAAQGG